VNPYWNPEQPPPDTEMRSIMPRFSSWSRMTLIRAAADSVISTGVSATATSDMRFSRLPETYPAIHM
jgi:hypothetical protein